MTHTKSTVGLFSLLLFLLCATPIGAQCIQTADGYGTRSFTLYAGQTIDAGSVTVTITGTNLVVSYLTESDWTLTEVHLWVGSSTATMPQTKQGNPIPGKFPYTSGTLTGATSYTFTIPLTSLGFSCPNADKIYYMAAHAALKRIGYNGGVQTETGWSEGNRIVEKGNWATMSSFVMTCNCDNTQDTTQLGCETAFARDAAKNHCFLKYNDFNRWGWSNGTYSPVMYHIDTLLLYAGAAKCDITKGSLAGYLTLEYRNTTADVHFYSTGDYVLDETHLYIGAGMFPINNGVETVAPGQYPYIHDDLAIMTTTDAYSVSIDPAGPMYLIGHATVCK